MAAAIPPSTSTSIQKAVASFKRMDYFNRTQSKAIGHLFAAAQEFKRKTFQKAHEISIKAIKLIGFVNEELEGVVLASDLKKKESKSGSKIAPEDYKNLLQKWVLLMDLCEKIEDICKTVLETTNESIHPSLGALTTNEDVDDEDSDEEGSLVSREDINSVQIKR